MVFNVLIKYITRFFNLIIYLVGSSRLALPTSRLSGACSNLLSYDPMHLTIRKQRLILVLLLSYFRFTTP